MLRHRSEASDAFVNANPKRHLSAHKIRQENAVFRLEMTIEHAAILDNTSKTFCTYIEI